MKKVFCSIVVPLFKPRYKSFFSVKNVCTHKIYITSIQNILHKTFKKCNDCWIKQYSTSRQRNSLFFVKSTNFCMHLMKKVNSFWCQGKNSPLLLFTYVQLLYFLVFRGLSGFAKFIFDFFDEVNKKQSFAISRSLRQKSLKSQKWTKKQIDSNCCDYFILFPIFFIFQFIKLLTEGVAHYSVELILTYDSFFCTSVAFLVFLVDMVSGPQSF